MIYFDITVIIILKSDSKKCALFFLCHYLTNNELILTKFDIIKKVSQSTTFSYRFLFTFLKKHEEI